MGTKMEVNQTPSVQAGKPLKIYVAGPYTASSDEQILSNVNKAIDLGLRIFYRGHFPYVPHLTHYIDLRAKETNIEMLWEDYIKWDMVWVELCDALFHISSSRGADIELAAAKKMGKQIFYSLDEIPIVSSANLESRIK
jgi:hypothetical protein